MPIWYVTIYEIDGRAWTQCCGDYSDAHKFARKNTHPRGRCSIHAGDNPEHGRIYAKVCGNLVETADA
jgi:hypothetical protein